MAKLKGIDVSKHNGIIDWEKVAATGIEFAIIRVGHGNDLERQDDPQAVRNMNECERLGIPYGVYLYSYALNEDDAESEAKHMLRMIKGRNPVMGIWFDMEDADEYKHSHGLPLDNSHSKLYTEICATFTTSLQAEGYKNVGIYASKSVLENIIGNEYLEHGDVKVWVAQWADKCTYKGKYEIWQYTSGGSVDGSSVRTDMNLFYGSIEKEVEKPVQPNINTTYKIGQHVVFSTCYKSSTDGIASAINVDKMSKNHGVITRIIAGRNNPYLIDDGLCWVNDGDIRGMYEENPKVNYYAKYTGASVSIVDAFQSMNIDNSKANRTKIATKNGIENYTGTAEQNTKMLNLLKEGKLIK